MRTTKKSTRSKGTATTIDEVAALAGVSPMTVSRVINGHSNVRDSTRERVMRAVHRLDYTPNLAASSLAAAKAARIAFIYTNPSAAYLSELLVGVLQGTARTTVQLVIDSWADFGVEARRNAARTLAKSVAGVILPPPLCESKAIISELVDADIPVVAIASNRRSDDVSRVRIDDFNASKEITEYLISLGHTRIGHIKGHPGLAASTRRLEGFRAALNEAGIPIDDELVQQGQFTYRSGLKAAQKLMALPNPPSAIFASNDDMAAAAVSVAYRLGLEVPGDLSVVGFDDTSAATMVWPELTTVRQPIAAMANSAVDILLRSIRRTDGEANAVVDNIVAHTLVKRDSAGKPRAAGG
ncbi:MAG TPA: LacI family DNA-binding transcriptional regulator [Rhodanobacteraceae bacterium]